VDKRVDGSGGEFGLVAENVFQTNSKTVDGYWPALTESAATAGGAAK